MERCHWLVASGWSNGSRSPNKGKNAVTQGQFRCPDMVVLVARLRDNVRKGSFGSWLVTILIVGRHSNRFYYFCVHVACMR